MHATLSKEERENLLTLVKGKETVQAGISNKKNDSVERAFSSWANKIEILDKVVDPYVMYWNTWTYLEELNAEKREVRTAGINL